MTLCISKAVNKHLNSVSTIIRNHIFRKKVEVKQAEPVIDIKIEDEVDAEIEALVDKKDKRPQISITQIGGSDDQQKIKFHK